MAAGIVARAIAGNLRLGAFDRGDQGNGKTCRPMAAATSACPRKRVA